MKDFNITINLKFWEVNERQIVLIKKQVILHKPRPNKLKNN